MTSSHSFTNDTIYSSHFFFAPQFRLSLNKTSQLRKLQHIESSVCRDRMISLHLQWLFLFHNHWRWRNHSIYWVTLSTPLLFFVQIMKDFIGTGRIIHYLNKETSFLESTFNSLFGGDFLLTQHRETLLVEIQKYSVKIFSAIHVSIAT